MTLIAKAEPGGQVGNGRRVRDQVASRADPALHKILVRREPRLKRRIK